MIAVRYHRGAVGLHWSIAVLVPESARGCLRWRRHRAW